MRNGPEFADSGQSTRIRPGMLRECQDGQQDTTQCIRLTTFIPMSLDSVSKLQYPEKTQDELGHDVSAYNVHSPFSPPPPPSFSFSPACAAQSLPVSLPPVTPAKHKFVSFETVLCRSPGLATCPSCQLQVTTQVTYRAGTQAWLVCVIFILSGLVLGCCLIPFVVDYFKDAYHTCPHCRRVLHVHKKTCCN